MVVEQAERRPGELSHELPDEEDDRQQPADGAEPKLPVGKGSD